MCEAQKSLVLRAERRTGVIYLSFELLFLADLVVIVSDNNSFVTFTKSELLVSECIRLLPLDDR